MFMIIYKKSTKHIVSYRVDTSTPAPQSAAYWFSVFVKDQELTPQEADELAFVETTPVTLAFDADKYLWNETTQQVEEDLSYVPPPPSTPPSDLTQPTTP